MKSITILLLSIILMMTLAACSTDQKTAQDNWKAQNINGVNINVKKISITKATEGDEKGKKILQVTLVGKNESPDVKAVDAFLLTIKNKEGKQLANYPSTNIGAILDPGEEITGDAFYVLEGEAPLQAVYQDPDKPKEKGSWEITDLSASKQNGK
ncbi:DUF4006 family protein [Listeria booriae]|uniref:DUF4006 family protein n=2 Tax=Listeria booriae TaxID=1552123 RepID=A0A841XVJ9_9LIST|nr:DUF4006 family protein [Listeria booriae]MBC2676739.1 DUF4006 family protein [Listeria booriae]